MRQYEETTKYVAKKWHELTEKEKKEVIAANQTNETLSYFYSESESDIYYGRKNDIINKNSELIDNIDVDWDSNSQGPYIRGDWEIELSTFPTYTCDMSKEGFGNVDVTVVDVYPNEHGILPKSGFFEFEFEWEDDNVTFEDIENAVDKCRDTYNVMVKYTNFINHAIGEYWDNVYDYIHGYETFDEYIDAYFDDGDTEFIFKILPNGTEQYVTHEYN